MNQDKRFVRPERSRRKGMESQLFFVYIWVNLGSPDIHRPDRSMGLISLTCNTALNRKKSIGYPHLPSLRKGENHPESWAKSR